MQALQEGMQTAKSVFLSHIFLMAKCLEETKWIYSAQSRV